MSEKLTETKQDLKSLINSESMKEQFARALPKHLGVERFTRICITALTRNPALRDCTPESFMKCLLDLSALGLEPDGRRAHLIPYKNNRAGTTECQLQLDYKGIIDIVRRDANVLDVQAYTIRANDDIIIKNGIPEHSFNPINDRGEVKAVYTKIAWKSGTTTYGEPLTRPEMESVRNRSQAWKSFLQYKKECPWNTDEVEMWKKTAIKRDSKMWPLNPEIIEAINLDDKYQFTEMRNVSPMKEPVMALPKFDASEVVETPSDEVLWGEEKA
jgi:recombination protein RecT